MRLKADWIPYLHELREREFRLIFGRFPPKAFHRALELGAGDGYQTRMLQPYVQGLVSTDYRQPPLVPDETLEVRALDAERIAEAFGPGEFDLVFSSNLLEHVRRPGAVLRAVHHVLKDDGVSIHVMPNQFWKLCHVVLHVPQLAVTALDEVIVARRPSMLGELLSDWRAGRGPRHGTLHDNNPTIVRPTRPVVARAILPDPHGVSRTNREEFSAFSRRRWRELFRSAGFELVAELKGPLSSGYGFGYSSIRETLEGWGLTSEFVYIAKKVGKVCRFEDAFHTSGSRVSAGLGPADPGKRSSSR